MSRDKLNTKLKNKHLIIALSILGCIILALVISIIIIRINDPTQPEGPIAEEEIEDDSWMTEEDKQYFSYLDDFEEAKTKVQELLNQDPIDTNAIDEIYNRCFNYYIEKGEPDRSSSFLRAWVNDYLAKDMKEAALNALTTANIEALAPADQYRRYTKLLELAQELGRDDLISKYTPLQAATKEAYDLDYQDSIQAEIEARELGNDEIVLPGE